MAWDGPHNSNSKTCHHPNWKLLKHKNMWVLVISIDKVFDNWIKNLCFNSRLHKKPINILIW